jgi:hypothetical protein
MENPGKATRIQVSTLTNTFTLLVYEAEKLFHQI